MTIRERGVRFAGMRDVLAGKFAVALIRNYGMRLLPPSERVSIAQQAYGMAEALIDEKIKTMGPDEDAQPVSNRGRYESVR